MLLFASLLLACSPSLDGDWEGPLDCGDNTVEVDMVMELADSGGGLSRGDGFIAFTEVSGTEREMTFDVDVTAGAAMPLASEFDLSIDLDDCRYDGRMDDCYPIKNPAWDRNDDVLTGDIDNFLGGWDCDFELER